jgi:single-strand DNA-binding protein
MSDTIILGNALVVTTPRHVVTSEGKAITSFRISTKRDERGDRTNYYTFTAFDQMAYDIIASVRRGDHITVIGSLSVRDWEHDEATGTFVEVVADQWFPVNVRETANA